MHGFGEAMGYISRMQFILRKGIPNFDMALINKDSAKDPYWAAKYGRDDLLDAGKQFCGNYKPDIHLLIFVQAIYTHIFLLIISNSRKPQLTMACSLRRVLA